MSKSTKTILIFAVLLFAFAISVFVFMLFQISREGVVLSEQLKTLEAERDQEDSFFRLQRQADDTTEQRQELENLFLTRESDSIDFLNYVESIAPRAGVDLSTEGVGRIDQDGSSWVQIKYSFTGPRDRVENFLRILETLPYVLRVDSYQMSNRSGSEWSAAASVRVHVLDYDQ